MGERRLWSVLVVASLVAAPAVVLRVACVGNSCSPTARAEVRVPFCPLPAPFRDLVVAGFRAGRSPDVMAAAEARGVAAGVADEAIAWPALAADPGVPIVFLGRAIETSPLPAGTGRGSIAPTLEQVLGIERPFPGVRAGEAIDGAWDGPPTPLVVQIAWRGIGANDLRSAPDAWPWLKGALGRGAGTLEATAGSLPLDPAATLTTFGTGGLPAQHGIVGSVMRGADGTVVEAWEPASPLPVISSLAEDLDELTDQGARIALVGTSAQDRGLIGGSWYPDHDRDDLVIGADPVKQVERLLRNGYGSGGAPDLIGVVLEGPVSRLDRVTRSIEAIIRSARPDAVLVAAGTGTSAPAPGAVPAAQLSEILAAAFPEAGPLIEAEGADGLFVDGAAASAAGIGADPIAEALAAASVDGEPVVVDAYPSFSVSLQGYC